MLACLLSRCTSRANKDGEAFVRACVAGSARTYLTDTGMCAVVRLPIELAGAPAQTWPAENQASE